MRTSLNIDQTRILLIKALRYLADGADYLNELDRAVGDGDHGTTIARGVKFVIRDLETAQPLNVNEVFVLVGKGMMKSMGGASGILYGVFFRATQDAPITTQLDCRALTELFTFGLKNLKLKTKAEVGDKTMVDALVPALSALDQAGTDSLSDALKIAAAAADKGARATVGLVPRFGRAKTLGERAIAAQDPGASSVALLFRGLAGAASEITASGNPVPDS
jgi:phosphoenolpyruvate---glycerone phosphotransferase subunit DhaL